MIILQLLIIFSPAITVGMMAAMIGRLGLHRLADGRYRGSALSWAAYLGGIALVTLAGAGMISLTIWSLTT